ncbi:MAG: TVP38/TMEM64 family protein [Acidobacteria bacterium]|nr:TVP38/TMEM64 family protein [Acidobacteriota bacterium]MXZ72959.1 TVP38/TMEM64 family protein [Acidobacteriota bacterium]MYD71090.1 TVP38/TMEM64 family protein [Acidobacteriota bacterium]MYJ04310.1 TVP38/TMEM64 family protein [Acidobacteriota bacterium]
MTTSRRIALGFWLVVTVGLSGLYAVRPDLIEPSNLVALFRQSGPLVLVGYVVVSLARPVTLIPGTVLVVVGTLLFPDRYWTVFAISLGCVVASSGLVYWFFDFLGLSELFERKHAERIRWLEAQMARRGFWIVAGWSLFPIIPTDVICYVAGSLRMPFGRFLVAVALGKLPLVAFYVTGGTWLFG